MQTLVFQLGDMRCGLPLPEVEEVIAAVAHTPVHGAPDVVLGFIDVRGRIATLLDIRRRLRLEPRPPSVSDHFILCNTGGRLSAICVERVLEIATVAEPEATIAGELAKCMRWPPGVTRLPGQDGLVLIYSLHEFLTRDEETLLDTALASVCGTGGWAP